MSIQKPIIGNQGPQIRSFQQGPPSFPGGGQYPVNPYPVIEVSSFAQPPAQTTASNGGGGLAALFGGGSGGSGASTGGSSFNMGQIKQMIDRLGGIEGIMETMTKVQRMVQNIQQFAPLLKVLMNSFGKGKKNNDTDIDGPSPNRRRRRKRKGSSSKGKRKRYTGR